METSTIKPKAAKAAANASTLKESVEQSNAEPINSESKSEPKREYRVKRNFDPNTIVTVYNGFHGKLVYISSRTKERFVWD